MPTPMLIPKRKLNPIGLDTGTGGDSVTNLSQLFNDYINNISSYINQYVTYQINTYTNTQASITFVIDGGGSAITTGVKGFLEIPFGCVILWNSVLADQSGSIVIDVWKDLYENYPPTNDDSITASAPPTITTATNSQDVNLTGWNKVIAGGDILGFNVDSCTSITRATLSLAIKKLGTG